MRFSSFGFYFMFETVCIVALANVNILFEIVIDVMQIESGFGTNFPKKCSRACVL